MDILRISKQKAPRCLASPSAWLSAAPGLDPQRRPLGSVPPAPPRVSLVASSILSPPLFHCLQLYWTYSQNHLDSRTHALHASQADLLRTWFLSGSSFSNSLCTRNRGPQVYTTFQGKPFYPQPPKSWVWNAWFVHTELSSFQTTGILTHACYCLYDRSDTPFTPIIPFYLHNKHVR